MRLPAFINSRFEILNLQSNQNFKNLKLKIFLFFFVSILFSLFSFLYSPSAFAQTTNTNQIPHTTFPNQTNYAAPNTTADVPKNLHTYTQNVMIETMAALACQIAGVDPTQPDGRCLGVDPKTGKIGYVENDGGAIGFMSNAITMLYTPPAHTAEYVQHMASNFGLTKNSYARFWDFEALDDGSSKSVDSDSSGSGFEGLRPLIGIWEAFRNIAYLLFVLVFVVIGVAVMLRIKIDPRTVMTIQNQIPKIIIGLILVTFSFAIAGFLIDIMWVVLYMSYSVFNSMAGVDVAGFNPINLAGKSPLGAVGGFGGIGDLAYDGSGAIKGIITEMFNNPIGNTIGGILGGLLGGAGGTGLGGIIGAIGGGIVGTFVAPGAGTVGGAAMGGQIGAIAGGLIGAGLGLASGSSTLGLIGGIIAFLILMVALLWALIRVWFTLLMAYIAILLGVVFAPFWIVGSLIPGSKISFIGWLRSMAGNLAAFPATLVMFLLGRAFLDAFSSSPKKLFVPPFIGNPGDGDAFGALIGLGIILTIPNVVKMMKNAFGAGQSNEPSPIGAALGVGGGVVGIPGKMGQLGYHMSFINQLPLINRFSKGRGSDRSKAPEVAIPPEQPVGTTH